MKTNIRLTLAAVALAFAGAASAQQNLSGGYFMEGNLYRHQLNPAFVGQQSYFNMPALGNFHLGVNGNLGVQDVLFNRNGQTVTYLHPDVSVADALSGIKDNNKFLFNLSLPVVSVGFRGFGGFNTIEANVRTFAGVRFGRDLFDLTKNLQNKSYNIGDFGVNAQAFVEVALGHSHKIDEHWSVGGKLKFLVGAARLDAKMNDLTLDFTGPDKWTATAHATVEANVKGLEITNKHESYNDESKNTKVDPKTGEHYGYDTVDDFDLDSPGIGGFGFAADLGTEYDFADIVPGLKLSLAVLDLGFINWNESHILENNGQKFTFEGFRDVQVQGGPGKKLSDQTDDIADRLEDLYRVENKGDQGSSSHSIGTTLNVGVEYALPVYDKVRFGLLSTTRFQGDYSWNEERLSINYAPARWFEFNVNGALGTFGPSFGWMLNLHPVGFNFFMGMDHMLTKVSKQFIPLRSNADFTMGINFPLTKVKKKQPKDDAVAYAY